jgi:hypothetical protein
VWTRQLEDQAKFIIPGARINAWECEYPSAAQLPSVKQFSLSASKLRSHPRSCIGDQSSSCNAFASGPDLAGSNQFRPPSLSPDSPGSLKTDQLVPVITFAGE